MRPSVLGAIRRNRRIAERAGQVERVARYDARLASLEAPTPASKPKAEPAKTTTDEPRDDGVHALGGGWHEIVVDNVVVDKLQGAEAAQEAYETLKETNDGD